MGQAQQKYRYLAIADTRFEKEAVKELSKFANSYSIERYSGISVISLYASTKQEISAGSLVFVDFVMSVEKECKTGIEEIEACAEELLEKGISFALEVRSIDAHFGERAKEIEVKVGRALEAKGYAANLASPQKKVYVLIFADRALLGFGEGLIDVLRKENKSGIKVINRAEYKLAEAFDFFGISLQKGARALDIGAAPGGWSHYLLSLGANVVAIDKALLAEPLLSKAVVFARSGELERLRSMGIEANGIDSYDPGIDAELVFIKSGIEELEAEKLGRFDLVCIDANIEPKKSAEIACKVAGALKDGAYLIMTAKLVSMNVERRMQEVLQVLGRCYKGIKFKKLPRNRKELTVMAVADDGNEG